MQHVVSVMPKIGVTDEGDSYTYYRAICVCRVRSFRLPTMDKGEEWARVHCEMPPQRPPAPKCGPEGEKTTTGSGGCL